MTVLVVIGLITLFIFPPLGGALLIIALFCLLLQIAQGGKTKAEIAANENRQHEAKLAEQSRGVADLRRATEAVAKQAAEQGKDSAAALAHKQMQADLAREEALLRQRNEREAKEKAEIEGLARERADASSWTVMLVFIAIIGGVFLLALSS